MNILLAFKAEPDAGMLAEKEWQAAAQGKSGPDISLLRSYSVLMNRPPPRCWRRVAGTDSAAGQGFDSGAPAIDFSKKAVDHLEEFVLGCVRSGTEARDILEAAREEWAESIFICTDISSA